VINLETSVTSSDDYWEGKGIHYRMNPQNIPCLTAAGIDCCSLANNHVLDWGYAGLLETLETLKGAKIMTAGAGRTLGKAQAPAVIEVEGKGRVLVFAFGTETSGIPRSWAASKDQPGVDFLADLSGESVQRVAKQVRKIKQERDVIVASIHWGGNWGYEIPVAQKNFAHRLIDDAGVDVIHGHSSHHVKALEVYQERLIIYGAGDFLNDYEGISGYEQFRSDLRLMYFPSIDPSTGGLVRLQMIPMQIRRFTLNRASTTDSRWLGDLLNKLGQRLGTRVELNRDNTLTLHWD
jgi:poly-gamma-glutamate synthesis protein (capsule biosynthesis protein)